jgi:hypothetical protein
VTVRPLALDYTSLDFDSLRERLTQLARSAFPFWTDYEVASFGTTLLEMMAFIGDVLAFRVDQNARESRLVTATQRANVIALARMLGYRLRGAAAATVPVEFSLSRVPPADVVVPTGTVMRTMDAPEPVRFQLREPVTIRAGQDPPRAMGIAEQSQSHVQLIDAVGSPYLEVALERSPYLDVSLAVTDGANTWTEVESLLASGPADRHFVVVVDSLDRATVRWGDGRNGLPPSGTLTLRYKTGGGARGNVEPGAIRVIESSILDARGQPVQLAVTNPNRANDGVERETIEHAKVVAPLTLRTPARSVAREDFEIHALAVPGVGRALMLTSNEDPTISENSGDLVIVPQGGGVPSQALLDAVTNKVTVDYPHTLTFEVRAMPPPYRAVNVMARLRLRPGAAPADVGRRIRDRLAAFFAPTLPNNTPNPDVNFGFYLRAEGELEGHLAWSDVANLVLDTTGVRKLDHGAVDLTLNGAAADVVLAVRQFPILGTVTLLHAETGAPF